MSSPRSNELFLQCAKEYTINNNNGISNQGHYLMIQCISDHVQELQINQYNNYNDMIYWLYSIFGGLIFVLQIGYSILSVGYVRKKNIVNTVTQNLLNLIISTLSFWCIGYALAYGGTNYNDIDIDNNTTTSATTFSSTSHFLGIYTNNNNFHYSLWFIQYCIASISIMIVAGELTERCQISASNIYSFVIISFIYPILVHNLSSNTGYFSPNRISGSNRYRNIGIIDFAGGGTIFMFGGCIALIACTILGPRVGRFYDVNGRQLDEPNNFPGHSVVLQSLGIFFLWFGWYGLTGGSALFLVTNTILKSDIAGKAVVNATLSAGTGAVCALLINMYLCRRNDNKQNKQKSLVFSLRMLLNGIISGLVAISSGCATVTMLSSILIGAIASIIFMYSEKLIQSLKIDDVTSGISIFFFNGIWSMIATGLLSSPGGMLQTYGTDQYVGLLYEFTNISSMNGILFTNQLIGICIILVWTIITTFPLFIVIDYFGLLRTPIYDEVAGLDISFHGGGTIAGQLEGENDLQEFSQRGHDNDLLLN